MNRPIITLTTDFGQGSPYVAQMKGVILSLNNDANLVDITHNVPPHDIHRGARVLDELVDWFPPDSIHIAVVDPGVGTDRKLVSLSAGGQHYIAPDNGLLSLVIQRNPAERIIAITNRQYALPEISATFHGRDIMAPAAAHLSLGLQAEELGETLDRLKEITWPEVRVNEKRIEGTIVSFDSFGNLITDITATMLADAALLQPLEIRVGAHVVRGLVHTYGSRKPGTLVALIGSSRLLELAVVNRTAADMLGVDVGDEVKVTW